MEIVLADETAKRFTIESRTSIAWEMEDSLGVVVVLLPIAMERGNQCLTGVTKS